MEYKRESKTVNLKVKKYFINGIHTCANNFETGDICQFFGARCFGMKNVCMVNGDDVFYEDGQGIKPHKDCILRGDK